MIAILKQLDELNLSSRPIDKTRNLEGCCWMNRTLTPRMKSRRRFLRLQRYVPYCLTPPPIEAFRYCRSSLKGVASPSVTQEGAVNLPDSRTVGLKPGIDKFTMKKTPIDDRPLLSGQLISNEQRYNAHLLKLVGLLDREDLADLLPLSLLSRRQASTACRVKNVVSVVVGTPGGSQTASCSVQARSARAGRQQMQHSSHSMANSGNALTVGELAAYLDEYLYLPKKMSFMAENMYN